MVEKKFTIDGRDYASYELSNEQLLRLIEDDTRACSDDRDFLMDKVLERFRYALCAREGETADDVFVRFFGNFVNGKMKNKRQVAELMGGEHRYLQNEMFKVCLEYIKVLADNCERGWYDGRNEYAAKTSKKIIDFFKEENYPY